MKLKTYLAKVFATNAKVNLSGNNYLIGKKILYFYADMGASTSEFGAKYLGNFEVTIYNKNAEIVRESLSFSVLANVQMISKEILQETTGFENIDLERSYVWFNAPNPAQFLALYFVVEE